MQPSLENGAPKSTRQTSNVTADDYVGLAMAAGAGGGGSYCRLFLPGCLLPAALTS